MRISPICTNLAGYFINNSSEINTKRIGIKPDVFINKQKLNFTGVSSTNDHYKNTSLVFYDNNASEYCKGTVKNDLSNVHDYFLSEIPSPPANILDLGSGSGRDTLAFIQKGYNVVAVDGSPGLAKQAEKLIRTKTSNKDFKVDVRFFEDINYKNKFDGIWACASLDHMPKKSLKPVLDKLATALKPNGILMINVRNGTGEEVDSEGRFVSYYDENAIEEMLKENSVNFKLVKRRLSSEDGRCRKNFGWHQIILKKIDGSQKNVKTL
jgi:SAM-dependent methyltransferase